MKPEKKIIEVNGKKYKIHASCASSQKTKDSYLQEKVEEHIKNCINLT